MHRTRRFMALALLASISLGPTLLGGALTSVHAKSKVKKQEPKPNKVASDLSQLLAGNSSDSMVKVILQLNDKPSGQLNALLAANGVKIRKHFDLLDSFALELPGRVVDAIATFPEVAFIAVDSEVRSLGGHVARTTGADNVRTMSADGALDGSGIGIAIVDSGIYAGHTSFTDAQTGQSRIVVNQDFTGEGRTDDPYGHGTHVAAAAAGNGIVSKGEYIGIAPRAKIVNLRVLNSKGIGSASTLLAAFNWLMANATTYNVRVVNLSVGMPAINSYRFDPVCVAVRALVDRGIVVVAAAGNNGKNAAGQKIYGQIHSPGNEPSAITVGAVDTKGTNQRNDDSVATYSSRGPTRSSWTDANGVKHFDNLIKPEISAPGNKTVYAQSPNNFLILQNPSLDAGVSNSPARRQMRLSGTSMAAPLAAGAAALMLEANPTLTPNLIKTLLMYTAQQLPNFNTYEQGAGELNIDGATRLAKLVRTTINSSTTLGASLLTGPAPTPQTSITTNSGVSTFQWSQGAIMGQAVAKGPALINQYQRVYAKGVLLGDGVLGGEGGVLIGDGGVLIGDGGVLIGDGGVLIGDATMFTNSVLIGDSILISNGTTLGSGQLFCYSLFRFGGVLIGDGTLMADGGVLIGDGGVLIGDGGVLIGDSFLIAFNALTNGDATTSMAIVPDDYTDYLGY